MTEMLRREGAERGRSEMHGAGLIVAEIRLLAFSEMVLAGETRAADG